MVTTGPSSRGTRQAAPRLLSAALLAFVLAPAAALALDFRSVASDRAVLYDGPTLQAKKLFVASKYYPVEAIVSQGQWVKVRDAAGGLAWVEKKELGEARMVVVTAARADVRQAADAGAPLAFQAERDVALELLEVTGTGWAKVRHRDGQSGYVQVNQVWGL